MYFSPCIQVASPIGHALFWGLSLQEKMAEMVFAVQYGEQPVNQQTNKEQGFSHHQYYEEN